MKTCMLLKCFGFTKHVCFGSWFGVSSPKSAFLNTWYGLLAFIVDFRIATSIAEPNGDVRKTQVTLLFVGGLDLSASEFSWHNATKLSSDMVSDMRAHICMFGYRVAEEKRKTKVAN